MERLSRILISKSRVGLSETSLYFLTRDEQLFVVQVMQIANLRISDMAMISLPSMESREINAADTPRWHV